MVVKCRFQDPGSGVLPGGAMGIRTPDLLHAMQALYQLSYSPSERPAHRAAAPRQCTRSLRTAVPRLRVADHSRCGLLQDSAQAHRAPGPARGFAQGLSSDSEPTPAPGPRLDPPSHPAPTPALAPAACPRCVPAAASGRLDGRVLTTRNSRATQAPFPVPAIPAGVTFPCRSRLRG